LARRARHPRDLALGTPLRPRSCTGMAHA
jgi:hypothetical protein